MMSKWTDIVIRSEELWNVKLFSYQRKSQFMKKNHKNNCRFQYLQSERKQKRNNWAKKWLPFDMFSLLTQDNLLFLYDTSCIYFYKGSTLDWTDMVKFDRIPGVRYCFCSFSMFTKTDLWKAESLRQPGNPILLLFFLEFPSSCLLSFVPYFPFGFFESVELKW